MRNEYLIELAVFHQKRQALWYRDYRNWMMLKLHPEANNCLRWHRFHARMAMTYLWRLTNASN